MSRVKRFLSSTWGPGSLLFSLIGFSTLFVAAADHSGSPVSPWTLAGMVLLLVLFGVGLAGVLFRLAGADTESRGIAQASVRGPAAQALLERWLRRSRYYRMLGGTLGFIGGIPLLSSGSSIFFTTLVGITVGGAAAEVHVLGRRTRGTAVAGLSVRSLRDYVNLTDVGAMAAIATGAVVVIAARLLGFGIDNSARWSIIALAVLGAVGALQHFVATRSRPALSSELRQADDLLRFLAATQGFARPAIALAFFMLATAVAGDDSGTVLSAISVGLTLAGVVWWYRGRHGRIPSLAEQALAS